MSGKLKSKTTHSWKSIHGNTTYQKLEEMFLQYNYSSLELDHKTRDVHRQPHGLCKTIVDWKADEEINMSMDKKVAFIMVDPGMSNWFRTEERDAARVFIGPSNIANHFEFGAYEVVLSIYDSRLHHGVTCTDYASQGTKKI